MKISSISVMLLFISCMILAVGCNKKSDDNSSSPLTVKDIDGNVYPTVTIGTQVWMAANLKVTHYRNGNLIPEVMDATQWLNLTTGAICGYNNDYLSFGNTYGALYNWYAADDYRNLAPDGWHIPRLDEWTTLINTLGGQSIAGGKMKETGTLLWDAPNMGATNSSGFSAVPGGLRDLQVGFRSLGSIGCWWSSTGYTQEEANFTFITYTDATATTFIGFKASGYSIRCVKN